MKDGRYGDAGNPYKRMWSDGLHDEELECSIRGDGRRICVVWWMKKAREGERTGALLMSLREWECIKAYG